MWNVPIPLKKKGVNSLSCKEGHLRDTIQGWASSVTYPAALWSPLLCTHSADTTHNVAKGHSATKRRCFPALTHQPRAFMENLEGREALRSGESHPGTALSNVASKSWDARKGQHFCCGLRNIRVLLWQVINLFPALLQLFLNDSSSCLQ